MKLNRRQKGIIGILFIIIMITLSWIGLSKLFPESNTLRYIPDRIYRIIKIVLGSDPSSSSLEKEDVPLELIIVKIGCVIILLIGTYKIVQKAFYEQYILLKASFKKNHSISIGASNKGKHLLVSIKETNHPQAVVIEKEEETTYIKEIKKAGHLIIHGHAENSRTLLEAGITRASNLFIFLNSETDIIEIINSIQQLNAQNRIQNKLNCYVHLKSPRLIDLVNNVKLNQSDHQLHIQFFNQHKMIARRFFNNLPTLYQHLNIPLKAISTLIMIGYSEVGKALLNQALRVLHVHANQKISIHIYSNNASIDQEAFLDQYPFANRIMELKFIPFHQTFSKLVEEELEGFTNESNLVITAFEDDEDNIHAAFELLHRTSRFDFPIFILNAQGNGLRDMLQTQKESKRLQFFGNIEEIADVELISTEKQDQLAKEIHADYLKLIANTASESQRFTKSWQELLEDAKDANRAQADHIIYKLALCNKLPLDLNHPLTFTTEEVETLAIIEHQRWMAHRYLQGWSFGDKRDDLQKLHPSLVPWEQLSESEKQKDRDTIQRIPILLQVQQ